jgi:hypothetical protein
MNVQTISAEANSDGLVCARRTGRQVRVCRWNFVAFAEKGACIDPHGYDAGKKIKGKKRHILVDTVGLLLRAIVHPADIQDREGGVLVMSTLFGMFQFLRRCSPTADIKDQNLRKRLRKFFRISALKSSSAPIRSADLWSCPNAGSLLIRSKFL